MLTFDGGRDLMAALDKLSRRVSRRLQQEALTEGAEPMRRTMEQLAARDTGKLQHEMVISRSRGQDSKEIAVAVGPSKSAYYGSFQELGTSRHAAHPAVRPAFDQHGDESLKIIGAALWRDLAGKGVQRPSASIDVDVEGEEV